MISQILTSIGIIAAYLLLKWFHGRFYLELYDLVVFLPMFIGAWIGSEIGEKRRQARLEAKEQAEPS